MSSQEADVLGVPFRNNDDAELDLKVALSADSCNIQNHTELQGNVVKWGAGENAERPRPGASSLMMLGGDRRRFLASQRSDPFHRPHALSSARLILCADSLGSLIPSRRRLTSLSPPHQFLSDNIQSTAEECCKNCRANPQCNAWVWCGAAEGCAMKSRAKGECWLKKADNPASAVYQWADVRSLLPPRPRHPSSPPPPPKQPHPSVAFFHLSALSASRAAWSGTDGCPG